ncbi:MAG: NUDIX hydrolase [Nitrosopumilus sp.]|nr:NUDIX hydrolase [Nitrosopumilus sp.]
MSDSDILHRKNYTKRAGIIPYMLYNQETYVLLGLSKEDNPVWADLGGRTEKGETVLETALREYGEESRHVLPVDINRITKIVISPLSPSVPQQYKREEKVESVIFFINVETTDYNLDINDYFQETLPKNQYEDEMLYLKWIPYHIFLITLTNLSPALEKIRQLI